MEKREMFQYGLILIGIGIIIGLVLSAGLNWTNHSSASPEANMVSASPSETPGSSGEATPGTPEISSSQEALNALSTAFADVAEKVNPSVVTIFTETIIKRGGQQAMPPFPFDEFFGDDFFKHFFQVPPQPEGDLKQMGLGSGVIVSEDGIILTNNHVVKGADNIKVRLMDGSEYEAEVKGTDKRTDLAVIKIKAKGLKAIKFGDSDKARVGEWVLAIGSPLSPELAHTVTAGIISAKGRSGVGLSMYEDYIQTDAAINPGNSGGALVNLKGELIGINSAIATRNGGFMGIGFAIPSNLARKVMNDILTKGHVVRGWLGVYIQNVDKKLAEALGMEKPMGVVVSGVQKDSPAEKAGLKVEDVIIKFNGKKVKNTVELSTWVAAAGPDAEVTLTVLRDGKEKEIKVKLGQYPEGEEEVQAKSKASEKIGLEVSNITPELVQRYDLKVKKNGVVITGVKRGSVAAQSGLRPGDVILKVNRKDVKNVDDYARIVDKLKPGDTVLFYIQRGDANIFVAFSIPKD